MHLNLEGSYSEIYPNVRQDEAGLKKLFMQLSFPGGISSHVAPTTPGSIHEGGESGYSLSHAFGAAFDNRELIVEDLIGLPCGRQRTGFRFTIADPGYKIGNPTVLARIEHEELD